MNTGLGLSFLRIVNEEGSNGWAQVYARVPFDNTELLSKGALFGVIFDEDKQDWAEKDSELMSWVEEYFNKIETEKELSDFFQKWREKYPNLSGVWLWILVRDDIRELMIARSGKVDITLVRNEKEFDFSKGMVEGKVVKGKIEEGDRIAVGTDGLFRKMEGEDLMSLDETRVSSINKAILVEGLAAAGIILDFQKFVLDDDEPDRENSIILTEKKVEYVPVIEMPPTEISQDFELANEKYVGPIGLKEKLINWWVKIESKFAKPIWQEGVIERKDHSKRKKLAVTLGVLFLALLLISLISGSIKLKGETELKTWKEFSEPIEKSLSEAVGLIQLNPSGARKLVQDSKAIFDVKKVDFSKGSREKDLMVLEKKINDAWTSVSGEKESQIEEVARIDLVRQGFRGDRMGLIRGKQLVVLDGAMGVIATVELTNKDIKVAAGKGEGLGWVDAVGEPGKIMILNGSGVRNAVTGQDLVKFDAAVVKAIAVGVFGGNLYVLDQGNKEIFRYAAVGESLGERSRWLKQDQNMGVVPVDMAIDGDIWVVSESGQVEKFRRGNKEQFSISGLTPGMKVSKMAVEIEGDRIALLDNTSGAVAICSKSLGSCSQLLKSQKLREVKDIEFDEAGELLVLSPGVIGVLK